MPAGARGTLVRAVATTTAYLVASQYASWLQDLPDLGAGFWPAAGVVIVGLLLSPRRAWPAIVATVVAAQFLSDVLHGHGAVPSGLWAAANVVGHLSVALLVRRWHADRLDRATAVLAFAAAAALGSAAGGVVGAVGTLAAGFEVPFWVTATKWAVGDGLGILTVTPLALALFGRIPFPARRRTETLASLAAVAAVTLLVFGLLDRHVAAVLDYLVLIPMLWAAARLRVAGAAAAVFLVTNLAMVATALGRGPFVPVALSEVQASALFEVFLGTGALMILLVGARTTESATFHGLANERELLLAAVSHELRTPLTPIVGFSELLLDRGETLPPREQRRLLAAIHRNGHHLTTLIDNLLLLSRTHEQDLPVEPQAVHLVPFLHELLHERGDVEVEVEARDPAAVARVDRDHLTQIVANLLDNAAKYGRPPVRVVVDADAHGPHLAVVDAGDGVPAWFLPRLFDVFAQATVGDRRPSLGLGLGLSIAHSLATANGGDLVYDRQHRGGARFVITLPAPPDPGLDAGQLDEPAAKGTPTRS